MKEAFNTTGEIPKTGKEDRPRREDQEWEINLLKNHLKNIESFECEVFQNSLRKTLTRFPLEIGVIQSPHRNCNDSKNKEIQGI